MTYPRVKRVLVVAVFCALVGSSLVYGTMAIAGHDMHPTQRRVLGAVTLTVAGLLVARERRDLDRRRSKEIITIEYERYDRRAGQILALMLAVILTVITLAIIGVLLRAGAAL